MYTKTLHTAALLAATFVAADQADQVLSKLGNDAKSLALENTVAANALYSWSATQTAVSDKEIEGQDDDYFNAFVTATATALPAYITTLPTSLQSYASSLLVGEASLVVTEIAPVISSLMASASASGDVVGGTGTGNVNANSVDSTSTSTVVKTVATSGIPSISANATVLGSPTTPPSPPKSQSSSGAGKNGVFVTAGMLGLGLAGIMSLL